MRHTIKYIGALIFLAAVSCVEPEDLLTENAKTGGLVDPTAVALNYVVGNPGPYEMEFFVKQGTVPTTEIRFYKQFVTTFQDSVDLGGPKLEWMDTTLYSNEVLDRTIAVTETENHYVATEYVFDELIADLEVSTWDDATPAPLSSNDGDYTIGDRWVFRIEVVLGDDRVIEQAYNVVATVSTRYAGVYTTVDAEYYRIGVLTHTESDWNAVGPMTIASIDAITYEQVARWGAFETTSLFFQVDPGTLAITYPATWGGVAQTGNGQPLVTCELNPADMTFVHCGTSNFVTNDDVTGKDRLTMSYGYFTPGSGSREFYGILEKIVD